MDQASGDQDEIFSRSGHVWFNMPVPTTDIQTTICVTPWRTLLTVLGILLVATDIPRTGLVFSKDAVFPTVGPGTVMYWGSYEYPVVHLTAAFTDDLASKPSSFNASSDGIPLEFVGLWPYKHDTLSIASRSIARHFNLTAYPPCVLNRAPCTSSKLESSTVFYMLDALMTTLATRALHKPQPLLVISKSHWVDRLHHVLFSFLTKNPEPRLHSVYYSASNHDRNSTHVWSPRGLCRTDTSMRAQSLPFFCSDPISWKCDHPIKPTGQRHVPIWDHMAIRFDELERLHPHLRLDFVLTVTTFTERTHSDRHLIPSVSYTTDALEISTVIRGRECKLSGNCRTSFIDEYRYERIVIESDVDEWRAYTSIFRGISQIYIWLRIALLVWGCRRAIAAESKHQHQHQTRVWFDALRVTLKIPSQSIVYGCWLPIIGYALAHHFDSCLVQTVGEFSWTTVGGFYNFDPVEYIMRASMQMRNVWLLSLACKLAVDGVNRLTRDRHSTTHSGREGLLAVRGGWIGVVSWLTTYSLMRALHFRDTTIVSVMELPSNLPIRAAQRAQAFASYTDYGLRFDLKCSLAACVIAAGMGYFAKALVRLITGRGTSVFISRSYYTPLSAGRLWSWSKTHTFWRFEFQSSPRRRSALAGIHPLSRASMQQSPFLPSPKRGLGAVSPPAASSCPVCTFSSSTVHWCSTQGCPAHEPIFDVPRRTKEIWSMVRLTNIAAMTDPLELFRLYVIGRTLHLYRAHCLRSAAAVDVTPSLVLLPTPPHADDDTDAREANAAWMETRLEFVADVDSRDVPWHVLINCG